MGGERRPGVVRRGRWGRGRGALPTAMTASRPLHAPLPGWLPICAAAPSPLVHRCLANDMSTRGLCIFILRRRRNDSSVTQAQGWRQPCRDCMRRAWRRLGRGQCTRLWTGGDAQSACQWPWLGFFYCAGGGGGVRRKRGGNAWGTDGVLPHELPGAAKIDGTPIAADAVQPDACRHA